jgi:predicted enzyme related to lactoylglutathione lyase
VPRVIHFEIHADDPERAAGFYRELLGWEIAKWDGPMEYWTIVTGPAPEPGINGGLMRRRGPGPGPMQAVNAYVCTVDVPDLDASLATVARLGCPVVVPRMAIPGLGWLAYAQDTEGNIFGMMQNDPAAT